MKRTLLFILFLCFGSAIYAQSINMDSIFEPKLRGEIFQSKTGIEGSQFYNIEWVMSDIKLSSGETVFNKQLKYNVLIDEVIWLQPGTYNQVKLEKHFIDEFYLKNYKGKTVCFKRIRAKLPQMPDSADIFVEVLIEKTASLYVFRSVETEGIVKIVNGEQLYFDKITPLSRYILILPDRQTILYKRISKYAFLKALPEKYKNILKAIIQQNHLSVRTENDLSKLVGLIEK
jgi:hypothetical protein